MGYGEDEEGRVSTERSCTLLDLKKTGAEAPVSVSELPLVKIGHSSCDVQ